MKEPLDEGERREWKRRLKTQHSKNEDHGNWYHHFIISRWGKNVSRDRPYFLGSKVTVDGDCSHEIKRRLLFGRKVMTNLDCILKNRDKLLLAKIHIVTSMVFQVVIQMWELDPKESWMTKNWCFLITVLEKTLESPLDCKKIQPVHPIGNQPWLFIGRTDPEV